MPDFAMRACLVLVPLLALGCAPKNRFLGTWDTEVKLMGNRFPLVVSFGQDKTCNATFELVGVKGKLNGTYHFKDERLSLTFGKLDLDTSKAMLPESLIQQGREAIQQELMKPQGGVVTWQSDNTFTVQPDREGAPTLTFKKVLQ